MNDDLIYRLRKRAEIRRSIPGRKSVQQNEPDRLADLLEEAANAIEELQMKPYGREKNVKGCGKWKEDHHLHKNGKKIEHWWEVIVNCLPRKTIKQNVKKEIENEN